MREQAGQRTAPRPTGRVSRAAGFACGAAFLLASAGLTGQAGAETTTATQAAPTSPTPASVVLPLLPVDSSTPSPLAPRERALMVDDLTDPALGPGVAALVADAQSPQLARATTAPRMPASTMKLLTATAALQLLGPSARIATSVVSASSGGTGVGTTSRRPERLVLVGGGDATLQTRDLPGSAVDPAYWRPATLTDLARRTAAALADRHVRWVSLGYDDALFTGPSVAPSWESDYVTTGVVAPVTALMTDEGLVDPASASFDRVADPAHEAADRFADLLQARGIKVAASVSSVPRSFDASARSELASVQSPPMTWLVERMLTDSDNQLAEALARLVAAADHRPASFRGAGAALRQVASEVAGAPATRAIRVDDGSGLSRADRLTATLLAALVRHAVDDASARPLLPSLPVAAFTGTLADRYRTVATRAGAGVVRAKTGTLTGVDTEAGIVVDGSGALRVFAFMADATNGDVDASRNALDAAASRLVP